MTIYCELSYEDCIVKKSVWIEKKIFWKKKRLLQLYLISSNSWSTADLVLLVEAYFLFSYAQFGEISPIVDKMVNIFALGYMRVSAYTPLYAIIALYLHVDIPYGNHTAIGNTTTVGNIRTFLWEHKMFYK